MKRAQTEPDSQDGRAPQEEDAGASSPGGTQFHGLHSELVGLMFRRLDQRSQHSFMLASKQVAQNPAILAQIQFLNCSSDVDDPLGQLLRFPGRARMQRLSVLLWERGASVAAFLYAAASDRGAMERLVGLKELRFKLSWKGGEGQAASACMRCC